MEERSSIPLWHAAAGTAWLCVASLLLLWARTDLAAGVWGAPRLLGATHALTLGWLLTITAGVLHQIAPAAMGVAPRSITAWRWLLPLLTAGTLLVVAGTAYGNAGALRSGWGITTVAVLAYAAILLGPFRASAAGRPLARRVALSFAALGATLLLALVRVLYGAFGIIPDLDALRLGHIALGLGGFGTLLGIGVALQLFPGFFGARDVSVRLGKWSFGLVALGVAVIGATSMTGHDAPPAAALMRRAGVALAAIGALCFAAQGIQWARARRAAALDPTLAGTLAGIAALGLAGVLALTAAVSGAASPTLLTVWGILMLPGWITLLITGVLLRVVPLMSWLERYGAADPVTRRHVRVAQLVRPGIAWFAIWSIALGVFLLALGAVATSPVLAGFGALGLCTGALALGSQLLAAWQLPPAVPVPSPLPPRSQ